MSSNVESNVRQDFDEVIQKIIEFVYNKEAVTTHILEHGLFGEAKANHKNVLLKHYYVN